MGEGLLQPMHLLLILGIALLVFGPRQLPKMGKALGESIREFRNVGKELSTFHDDDPKAPK